MTRTTLALASLPAALPAGILAFLLVSTFLTRFEAMGGMLSALAGMTLALSALVALMPVGILVFGPRAAKPAQANAKAPKSGEAPAAAAAAAAASSGELSADELASPEDVFSDGDMELSDAGLEIDEDEVVVADDDVFDEAVSGEYEDFDVDVEDEEQA